MKRDLARPKDIWIGTLLIMIAALLFSRNMVRQPLWQDEAWSLTGSELSGDALNEFFHQDLHPPLYTLLLHGWRALAGDRFFALRLPSLLFLLLTTALVYRMGWSILGNRRAAIIATLIVATSDFMLALGPIIRQYALYVLLGTTSFWLYWRYSQTWELRRGAVYVLAGLGLLYTLYWGAFLLLAQGLHTLIFHRQRLKYMVVPALLIGIGYLPWLPVLYATAFQTHDSGALAGLTGGYREIASLPADLSGLNFIFFELFGLPRALLGGLVAAGLAGGISARSAREWLPDSRTTLAGLWLALPVALPFLVTLLGYRLMAHHPLVGLVPAVALLAGHALSQFRRNGLLLLTGIILLTAYTTTGFVFPGAGGPWWNMAAFFKGVMSPEEALLLENRDTHAHVIEYHVRQINAPFDRVIRRMHIDNGWFGETDTDAMEIVARYPSLWFVEYFPERDLRPELKSLGFVQTTPELTWGWFLGSQINVVRYARPPSGEPVAVFGDILRVRAADHFHHDGALAVTLTWDTRRMPKEDYTISVFLLNSAGVLVAQHDGFPLFGNSPTSDWIPGHYYFDRHILDIDDLPPGQYRLGLATYTWQDGVNLLPEPCGDADCRYIILDNGVNIGD